MNILNYWLTGIRIYIAIASVAITGLILWSVETAYGGTSLATIRMQEIFAWISLALLVVAISIGPIFKIFPRLAGRRIWFESRRMIGVSAAWFATLHVTITYIVLFKVANPFSLSSYYRNSFAIGGIALLILLAMAFTSFNKAFQLMGIWWYRLHRLVYLSIVLILLHIFMIGVHSTHLPVLYSLGGISILLVGAYVTVYIRSTKRGIWQTTTVSLMTLLLLLSIGYGFHQHFKNSAALSSAGNYKVSGK
jgi:sulfoxide reductase heme-binding subunit YedZ